MIISKTRMLDTHEKNPRRESNQRIRRIIAIDRKGSARYLISAIIKIKIKRFCKVNG